MKGKITVNMWNKTKGNQFLFELSRVLLSDIVKCSRPMVVLPRPRFKATQVTNLRPSRKEMRLRQRYHVAMWDILSFGLISLIYFNAGYLCFTIMNCTYLNSLRSENNFVIWKCCFNPTTLQVD